MRNFKLTYIFVVVTLMFCIGCSGSKYQIKEQVGYQVLKMETSQNNTDTFLSKYKLSIDSIMNVVVGQTTIPLTKSQPESTMGNFIADAQLYYSKNKDKQVVASVINYGGLRIPFLPKGNITVGNIFEIMPFDNKLVIVEVPGSIIKKMAEHIAKKKGWPIAGIKIIIDEKSEKVKGITIDDKAINDNLIYKISMSDYLANGGDDCDFFKECKRTFYNVFIRDVVIDYLKENSIVSPELSNRIIYE